MSITVVNYLDQALVDRITAQAAERAAAASASYENDFSSALNAAMTSFSTSAAESCPTELEAIFDEASQTYGVSSLLLKAVAKTESAFRSDAVSSAGAVGIMQLMPATAAALGVTNSYDAKENIMGGAKYLAQLLAKYNGNTVLALAAYNAGSSNVDQYGGIPPFTETQNYVRKIVSALQSF
ncbi:MAG: lytic transglycosylase domain-containing protein [Roseburia sp.]